MKREILFRGLSFKGEWVYGFLIQYENSAQIGVLKHPDVMDFVKVRPETVGQFTGLTDKSGKRIFEGDVVSYIESDYTYVISYENGLFIASHTKIKAHDHTPLKWGSINGFNQLSMEIEVIGSIHDNPELYNPELS